MSKGKVAEIRRICVEGVEVHEGICAVRNCANKPDCPMANRYKASRRAQTKLSVKVEQGWVVVLLCHDFIPSDKPVKEGE